MSFERFYRVLLLAYPATFRRTDGQEAALVFAEACRDCWRGRKYGRLLARLARAVVDVPVQGMAERVTSLRIADRSGSMSAFPADLRDTFRSLRRTPAFTITAVLTMTIGIALNTAMFTAFNAMALRGWPGAAAEQVVLVSPAGRRGVDVSAGLNLEDLRQFQRSKSLAHVAATHWAFQYVATEPRGRAHFVHGTFVTAEFFDAVGISMARGRTFRADEDREGAAEPVVVISHALWRRLFASEETVLGRSLYFGSSAFQIIGVAPEQWRGAQPYRDDVWLPMQSMRVLEKENSLFAAGTRQCCVDIVGRLAAHTTREAAAEELSVLSAPSRAGSGQPPWRVVVTGTALLDRLSASAQAAVFAALLTVTALILLLTGANITHLQLARASARAREMRTRLALGAGRFRIIRQLATEATVLAAAAGALGLALVYALLNTLMHVAEIPVVEIWRPDLKVFVYCLAVSLAMSLTFGLLPALRSTRVSLAHGSGQTATPLRLRSNLVLLTTQIALSVTLLAGAAVLTRALSHATHGDAGFAIEGLTVATIQPGRLGDGARLRSPEFRQALSVALSSSSLPPTAFVEALPLMNPVTARIQRHGDTATESVGVAYAPMSAAAFEVFGIPLLEGRPFDDRSDDGAVINQTAAHRLWPGESALGRAINLDGRRYVITGVTRDVHYHARGRMAPTLHVPSNLARSATRVVMRAPGPGAETQVRAIVQSLDPHATVTVRSLTDILEDEMTDERAGSQAAWAGGLLALALATFGVFGVFVYVAEERRREIGIRIALGAQSRDVLETLFRPARRAVIAGLALGLLLSLALAPLAEDALYGLNPFDPRAFATVAAIIGVAALVATVVPARRALRVDPVVVLRAD